MDEPEPKFSPELLKRLEEIFGDKIAKSTDRIRTELGEIVEVLEKIEKEKSRPIRRMRSWLGAILLGLLSSALWQMISPSSNSQPAISARAQVADSKSNKKTVPQIKPRHNKNRRKSS